MASGPLGNNANFDLSELSLDSVLPRNSDFLIAIELPFRSGRGKNCASHEHLCVPATGLLIFVTLF